MVALTGLRLDARELEGARQTLERARAILEDPDIVAKLGDNALAQFNRGAVLALHAQLLADSGGSLAEARAAAKRARQIFVEQGESGRNNLQNVERWLAEHGGP